MLEITCLPKVVRPADCGAMGDTLLVSGIQVHDTVTGNDRTLFHPVQGEFTGHGVRLFDAYGNSISFDYSDSDKTREQLEELLEVCFCCSTPTDYLLVNNTPVGYIPSPSGNLSNLNEVITDSAGDDWIIDILGNAKKMAGTVTSVNASISGALSVSGGPITTSGTLAFSWTGTSSQYVRGDGSLATFPSIPAGTVTSVALSMPTGFTVSGSPITTSGTLAVTMAAGYVIPTTTQVGNWNTAYGWGDSKGRYVALSDADAGYSGQLSAVNLNDYTKTQVIYSNGNVTNNPNATSYVVWIGSVANTYGAQMAINPSISDKFFFRNNNNTSWSSWYQVASREWVISQNYTTNTGTVTSVGASISGALSVTGSPITTSGTLAFSWTGTSGQYVRGDGSLATFPSIPAGTVTSVALSMPTGFTVSGSPITSAGTFAVTMASGYAIPTTLQITNWNTAYGWGDSKGRYVSLSDGDAGYAVNIGGVDANLYTKNAELYIANGLNLPALVSKWGILKPMSVGSTYGMQWYKGITLDDNVYFRGLNNGVWGDWYQVASRQWVAANYTSNTGTVTNVGASVAGTALTVAGGPITTSGTLAFTWLGTALQYVDGKGELQTFPAIPSVTPAALTKNDDTNVTLTLGGTPATSLLQAVSLTLGWTSILAIGRGGTGLSALGTANQLLRVDGAGTALEYFTPTWTSNTGTVTSVAASVGGTALGVSGTPITSSGTLAFAWAGTSGQYVDGQGNLQNFPAIPAGTVTSVNASISGALSVSGGPITTSGTLAFSWTGTSGQYVRGDGSLAAFPLLPTVNDGMLTMSAGTGLSGSATFSANQSGSSTFTVAAAAGYVIPTTTQVASWNTISRPVNEIAYGTGTGITSNGNLKYNGYSGLQIGGGTNIGYCAINIGNGIINNRSSFSFVLTENTANVISGLGNSVASFIIGSNNTITTADSTSSAYHNKIFGYSNSISVSASNAAVYNFISGTDNMVTDGSFNNILGHNVTNNGYSGCLTLTDYGGYITLTANNQFTARFANGYRLMKSASVRMMEINSSGQLTIDNLAGSGTRMVVANSTGLLSTQAIPSGSNSVWYIQGTATDATTNAQDIVRTGRVRIGATGTSTYMLSVVGDAYIMNGSIINNNMSYAAFSTAVSPITLAKLDTSNRVQLSQSGVDIILPSYLSSRADSISPVNFLCTTASGVLQSRPVSDFTSSFAMTYASSDVTITSGGGWVNLTFPNTNYALNTTSIYSVDNAGVIVIPNVIKYHRIDVTLQWETTSGTSGSPVIEVRCQVNNTNIYNNPTFIAKPTGVGDIIKCHFYTASTGTVTISCRVTSGASCYIKTRTLSVEDRGNAPG